MTTAFLTAVEDVVADPAHRVLVMMGVGRAFVAGGDLAWLREAHDRSAADKGLYTAGYQRTALLFLTLVYVFNFVDRQVLNILAEAIKVDLSLSDTQLGLVTGLAFALFYSLLGLPLARYAERGDRPGLIALALTV